MLGSFGVLSCRGGKASQRRLAALGAERDGYSDSKQSNSPTVSMAGAGLGDNRDPMAG